LSTDRVDVVLVHDPDDHEDVARRETFPTLLRLRDEGVVHAVGCGMNQVPMLERFVADIDIDCVLLAGRYSLLDRSGAELLAMCGARTVGVIVGGVFNSGVLADPDGHASYDYAPAAADVVARARELRARCATHAIALPAAALQFAGRHPAVTTVVIGARSAEEVQLDAGYASAAIPEILWSELDRE
jgi:D-threo-aldose 1-dehydrogenase